MVVVVVAVASYEKYIYFSKAQDGFHFFMCVCVTPLLIFIQHIAHETAVCRKTPTPSFIGGRKNATDR